ncbi:MAG: hypothetical protein P8K08_18665 [Fuerstiella sp.]|nr:hypothetical protein [Fuerstiella sp.]
MPQKSELRLATFRCDITPPLGHSLCGGWIPAVSGVDDPLEAIGFVLLGAGRPIVLCALDWTGLCNSAHLKWRQILAGAAGTTVDRVAVQCLHQHDAPFVCLETDRIIRQYPELPPNVDPVFFQRCLNSTVQAVSEALTQQRRITHVATALAEVSKIASNRRILGDDGRVLTSRSVAPGSNDVRALPAGVIDPMMKSVAFFDGATKVAACYYYAVHPISYCCKEGRVSSEFVGLARRLKEQHDQPDCAHIYFTGCAGNINTGKYNNSEVRENRQLLTERMFEAMEQCSSGLKPEPIREVSWNTKDILPDPNRSFSATKLATEIADSSRRVVQRNRPAFTLAWLQRVAAQRPVTLSALHINSATILNLPGEPFVEYQLRAQAFNSERVVSVAGYGDGGPWYIPTAEAYTQGGYEAGVAFCDPEIDLVLTAAIHELITSAHTKAE